MAQLPSDPNPGSTPLPLSGLRPHKTDLVPSTKGLDSACWELSSVPVMYAVSVSRVCWMVGKGCEVSVGLCVVCVHVGYEHALRLAESVFPSLSPFLP